MAGPETPTGPERERLIACPMGHGPVDAHSGEEWLVTRHLPLNELVQRCRLETARFIRREPARDDYGFELFRRAIITGDEAAWEAIITVYRGLVLAWIAHHPGVGAVVEDREYWLNGTFERFWGAMQPERFAAFPNLPALLRYLKLCVNSVVVDDMRRRAAHGESPADGEATADGAVASVRVLSGEERLVGELVGQQLWQTIAAELQDDEERLIADLSFLHELKPREIHERHPERYPSVAHVYRVKRNIIERLRRSAEIRQFLR